jgi:hypothetical protein
VLAVLLVSARVCRFQHHVQECVASGDKLGQALCRGQVIGGEHAAVAIDEEIIGLFDLWEQYDDGTSQARQHTSDQEAPQAARPPTGNAGLPRARQQPHPADSPNPPEYPADGRSLGLGRLEAAVMAVAWREADNWLPPALSMTGWTTLKTRSDTHSAVRCFSPAPQTGSPGPSRTADAFDA